MTVYQKIWESTCAIELDVHHWDFLWNSPLFKAPPLEIRLQAFKILAKGYLIPNKVAHITSSTLPLCWEKSWRDGLLWTCWSRCPVIHSSLIQASGTIRATRTGFSVPLTSELTFLNPWDGQGLPSTFQNLIISLLIVAKFTMATTWCNEFAPCRALYF